MTRKLKTKFIEECPDCGKDLELQVHTDKKEWFSQDFRGKWIFIDADDFSSKFLQCNCGYSREVDE